jgi:hypothetical protein
MTEPTDPFAAPESADQLSLFGLGETRMQPPVRSFVPDPATIRERLHMLLAMARDAKVMPWPDRDAKMWQVVFPQMADWLPSDEADQLRFEFVQEFERLMAA